MNISTLLAMDPVNLAAEIRRRIVANCDPGDAIPLLKHALAVRFAEERGLKLAGRPFGPSTLARRSTRRPLRNLDTWPARFMDHGYYYRDRKKRATAAVAHLYADYAAFDFGPIFAFAEKVGLQVSLPTTFPSWWYPRRTTLVVYSPLASDSAV